MIISHIFHIDVPVELSVDHFKLFLSRQLILNALVVVKISVWDNSIRVLLAEGWEFHRANDYLVQNLRFDWLVLPWDVRTRP